MQNKYHFCYFSSSLNSKANCAPMHIFIFPSSNIWRCQSKREFAVIDEKNKNNGTRPSEKGFVVWVRSGLLCAISKCSKHSFNLPHHFSSWQLLMLGAWLRVCVCASTRAWEIKYSRGLTAKSILKIKGDDKKKDQNYKGYGSKKIRTRDRRAK